MTFLSTTGTSEPASQPASSLFQVSTLISPTLQSLQLCAHLLPALLPSTRSSSAWSRYSIPSSSPLGVLCQQYYLQYVITNVTIAFWYCSEDAGALYRLAFKPKTYSWLVCTLGRRSCRHELWFSTRASRYSGFAAICAQCCHSFRTARTDKVLCASLLPRRPSRYVYYSNQTHYWLLTGL